MLRLVVSFLCVLLLADRLIADNGSKGRAINAVNVDAARWLIRHQHADGHWSSSDYTSQCKDPENSCKMHGRKAEISGVAGNDVAVTSLAILAFSSLGHTHKMGEYPEIVESTRNALKWLLKQQNLDSKSEDCGSFGKKGTGLNPQSSTFIYSQALATKAVSETLFLSSDKAFLGESVKLATNWCLKNQSKADGGWGYHSKGASDCSVSGWMVYALISSRVCAAMKEIPLDKKEITGKLELAGAFFRKRTDKDTHIVSYSSSKAKSQSRPWPKPQPFVYSNKLPSMTAVALVSRLLCGEKRTIRSLVEAKKIVVQSLPKWQKPSTHSPSSVDLCHWYFTTYGLFQLGGEEWDIWKDHLYTALMPGKMDGLGQRQAKKSCEEGSWDPIGRWGAAGGRVYSTAMAMMSLGVYYRYSRTAR